MYAKPCTLKSGMSCVESGTQIMYSPDLTRPRTVPSIFSPLYTKVMASPTEKSFSAA